MVATDSDKLDELIMATQSRESLQEKFKAWKLEESGVSPKSQDDRD